MAEVLWTKRSQQECSWGVLHSALWIFQSYLSAWIIWKKYVELLFNILIYASTTQKVLCSFELSLFGWIPTLVYQLIVKSMSCICAHRCILFLWSVKPFYSGMTRRNKLQYLVHIQDLVKIIVYRRSKCQSSFCSVPPWSITIFISRIPWELHTILWTLDTVILLALIIHFSVSVLLQPECRQVNRDVWNLYS